MKKLIITSAVALATLGLMAPAAFAAPVTGKPKPTHTVSKPKPAKTTPKPKTTTKPKPTKPSTKPKPTTTH